MCVIWMMKIIKTDLFSLEAVLKDSISLSVSFPTCPLLPPSEKKKKVWISPSKFPVTKTVFINLLWHFYNLAMTHKRSYHKPLPRHYGKGIKLCTETEQALFQLTVKNNTQRHTGPVFLFLFSLAFHPQIHTKHIINSHIAWSFSNLFFCKGVQLFFVALL